MTTSMLHRVIAVAIHRRPVHTGIRVDAKDHGVLCNAMPACTRIITSSGCVSTANPRHFVPRHT